MFVTQPSALLALFPWLLALTSLNVQADSQRFGDYTVHYTVFNSTFVQPEIAQAHNLVRARDRALVNISVTRTIDGATTLGQPARVQGAATNLMQQRQPLDFMEISESDATYYIASLRHTNEETYNLTVRVQPSDSNQQPFELKFTRKLYVEK